jgi:Spy/CpxP family protein refolding chaperone
MSKKLFLYFLCLSLAGLATVAGALAQPAGTFGPRGERAGVRDHGFQDKLMEIKRSQLGPALGVDQRTVDRLLQIDARYKPQKHRLIMEMKSDLRSLQQVMGQPSPSEQEVKAILSNMKRKKRQMLDLQQRKDEEEMAILTPVQQARYILYLMNLVREARHIKEGPQRAAPLTPQEPREIPAFRPIR